MNDPRAMAETISHYRLIERLGAGGMGEVWLAEDTELPRRVAIKLLPQHLAGDHDAVERLLREARAAATVDHPAVVSVYESGMAGGRPYIVMQRVEGETLEVRLVRGPLGIPEAVEMASRVADALAEVHALGIVHRDLKPANVILTQHGPKILDFGVASLRGSANLTSTGQYVGTPNAMSPEQLRGLPPDNRSDLWALGVMLYHALTGATPFEGAAMEALLHQILNHAQPPPSALRPGVTQELDYVVQKLLRKDPALRYARAEDVVADLESLAGRAVAAGVTPQVAGEQRTTPRVAVLYFEVIGNDPDDAFLAAGLTEDLIVDLTRLSGVHVASRADVLPYRDRPVPPRTLARELRVDYVLMGSVRRAGQRARISAQLVRATDGQGLWADRFDRTLEDLFDVQAEVSKRIVEALDVALRPGEREMLDRAPTKNAEAYRFYLRGRELLDQGRDGNVQAEELLKRAIELDSEFALAHAALAECYGNRAQYWWGAVDLASQAEPHVERALALAPDLFEAHFARAILLRQQGDPERLLAAIQRLTTMDPDNGQALEWAAWSYLTLDRPEEARPILERMVETHPERYRMASLLADCYDMLGRQGDRDRLLPVVLERAMDCLRKQPTNAHARSIVGITLIQKGEVEAGLAQVTRATEMAPLDGRVQYNAACAYARAGQRERAMEQLKLAHRQAPAYIADWPSRDPDLKSLHDHPEFIRMFGHA